MKSVSPSVSFPELEKEIRAFWREGDIFKKSISNRSDAPNYLFYDGPPFATGTPHYGHLIGGTLKDVVPRYYTMKGFSVERRFGWDTHGLPVELLVEKKLSLNGRADIMQLGVDKFNAACRASILDDVAVWERITEKLGRWVDFKNDYKTMDVSFMESVWWVFHTLWNKGRIYEGLRVMPYSWRLETTLSNMESGLNYKEVQDPAVTVAVPLNEKEGVALLLWTTTPWTLPSNMALCVGPEIPYVVVKQENGQKVLLAESRAESYFGKEYTVVERLSGKDLVGLTYTPPFEYFLGQKEKGAFRVVADEYVSTEDGTGIVHLSPAHGEDDFRIAKREGVPLVDPIQEDGSFSSLVPDFAGQNIKDAEKGLIQALKARKVLFKQDTVMHSYPHCWRSDTPLIYKAVSGWYVKVDDLREEMVRLNEEINWVPEFVGRARFGNWLKEARDWNISRARYWGNPLPIWRCDSCGEVECLGSKIELERKAGKEVPDLHKEFVDLLQWKCASCSGQMKRVPEVLDCWFESGAMPYAQLHYPFENHDTFQEGFPAHFIAEGLDQTRGWFYTLMVLSASLFNKAPFRNVIVNGLILAEDGKKMSKSLKNYPDPEVVLDTHGADALRLYLITSPAVRAETLKFSETGVKEVIRAVLLPLWNAYSFFTTYAEVDGYVPSAHLGSSKNPLDRWVVSRLQSLLSFIEQEMRAYRVYTVTPALLGFLEDLTNWYVRRSRRRFWSNDRDDKQDGYDTLYFVLLEFSKALAPFAPFISEAIYQNLHTLLAKEVQESVHLCDYPVALDALIDPFLEEAMELVRTTVSLGRALRSSLNIRIRQPLQSITVVTKNPRAQEILREYGEHCREELNVKEVLFTGDEEAVLTITVKPNFPVLGKKVGKKMGEIQKALLSVTKEQRTVLEKGGTLELCGETLSLEDVQIVRTPKEGLSLQSQGEVAVFFDTNITPPLYAEGIARELVNRIQKMRKDADYHISDRIRVECQASEELIKTLEQERAYIQDEVLAKELEFSTKEVGKGDITEAHDLEGAAITVSLSKK